MISVDLECENKHRFEGEFKNSSSYKNQLENGMIACPVCGSMESRRLYTGCSFQAGPTAGTSIDRKYSSIFEALRSFNNFVRKNFENVGDGFTEKARAMHYDIEEKKYIRKRIKQ
ncbi:MAG: DUF1178 family protein [Spirochaetes bacterium]|jgi:hypothetical protein|nr:DUF1178 family protein [Spirochaetota bacterium]